MVKSACSMPKASSGINASVGDVSRSRMREERSLSEMLCAAEVRDVRSMSVAPRR